MNIVKKPIHLKRRVRYFIDSERKDRKNVTAFLQALSRHSGLFIFGGMIRDIGLFGARGFNSDIDLVYDGSRSDLLQALTLHGVSDIRENKFGGFRLKQFEVDIDIWSIEETWAFKRNYINRDNVESLLSTTLMTWDAILYDMNRHQIIASADYLNDLKHGRLDLVLDKTPDEKSALIRILRTIYTKQVLWLGSHMNNFLLATLRKHHFDSLIKYEFEHYNTSTINELELEKLYSDLQKWDGIKDLGVNTHLHHK